MNETSIDVVLEHDRSRVKDIMYIVVKRVFDIIVSGLSLILLLPIFLIIGIMIKSDSKGPVFYKHKRIGKNGEYIYLYKFRSMYIDSQERLEKMLENPKIRKEWEENFKLKNDPRITKIGNILRKISLDELPQLLNIFNGDIGFIEKILTSKESKSKKNEIHINYDGNIVVYTPSKFKDITHGYAISIHKAQGSEFDVVIIPVVRSYSYMLYNKLIYTAITRAKNNLLIIGDKSSFIYAVKNDIIENRKTSLKEKLINKYKK